MSSISINDIPSCANCGKGEEESGKLKSCTACKLVKYCSRECQIAHRPQHKKECRKRAAELHDEKLFKQPPPLHGDCPICFLRIPSMESGAIYESCCGKVICSGCSHTPVYDNQGNKVDGEKCAFCRTPAADSYEEAVDRLKERMEAGDSISMHNLGCYYRDGKYGLPQDYDKAMELFHQSGALGCTVAYKYIGHAYMNGRGIEVDQKKANYYFELAAIRGDVHARHILGINEEMTGSVNRALKHYTIAARDGNSNSLKSIKQLYTPGHVTKEDYTTALQSYQAYLSEIKSAQRDKAAADYEVCKYY